MAELSDEEELDALSVVVPCLSEEPLVTAEQVCLGRFTDVP